MSGSKGLAQPQSSSYGKINNNSSSTLTNNKNRKTSASKNPIYSKILAKGVRSILKPSLSNPVLTKKNAQNQQIQD
jgi:hypothetical protein